jgi:stress-induced-phosphoprotein 1
MGDRAAAVAKKNEANQFFKNYKWNDAIRVYTEGAAIDATYHILYSNRSQAYINRGDDGDFEKAAADGKLCIQYSPPDFVKGYHRLANAQYMMGDFGGCLKTCQLAESKGFRGNKDIDTLYARCKGKAEKQAAKLKASLTGAARSKAEGNDFFKKGNYDEAIVWYTKALEQIPGDISTLSEDDKNTKISCFTNRSLCYMQHQNYRAVINDCSQALELDEGNVKALFRRACAFEGLEKYRLALQDIRKCTAAKPGWKAANDAQHRLDRAVRQLKAQSRQ